MGPLFGLLAAVTTASVAIVILWSTMRSRHRWWQKAVAAAGLTNLRERDFLGLPRGIYGRAGDLEIAIESYHRGKEESGTRIVISGFRHGAYGLTMRAEGLTSTIEKTFGEREIEVGDREFDEAVYAQGSSSLIRALLDAETRGVMRTLLGGTLLANGPAGSKPPRGRRVLVAHGELRVDIRSSPFRKTEEWLPAVLPVLIATARRLQPPEDLAARIAENLRGEAVADVRLLDLKTLASDFPGHPATHAALIASLGDSSPAVRLHAATVLGPEGHAVLFELASTQSPDEVAAKAVAALGAAFGPPLAVERLRTACEAGHVATALACIDILGGSGDSLALNGLVDVMRSTVPELVAAAARALGRRGGSGVEAPLVEGLAHESQDVRVAAAESLGRVGSVLAVVPLRDASSEHMMDGALRRAARQAIAEIQSRVTGASPGQLSLADGEAGQVSLVDEGQRGELSLDQAAAEPQGEVASQVPSVSHDEQASQTARAAQAQRSRQAQ